MTATSEIEADEPLVRIIKTPQHLRKDGVHPSAWRPQRDTDRVSVVRWRSREQPGEVFKARCQSTGRGGAPGANTYCGLGVIVASRCLDAGTELEDAPDEYSGHAHIIFPFSVSYQEPQEGENFRLQAEISHRLKAASEYVPDPDPASPQWTIESPLLPD